MKLSRKLPVAFALIVLASLAAGLWGIWRLDHALGVYRTTIANELANEQQVADVQSAFKVQVQEWKNVLLRGKDETRRERHWSAFVEREAEVAKNAKALAAKLPEGELRKSMADFVAAHEAMAGGYRKGLEAFKAAGMDPTAGDAAVRGVDRAPTELLDQLGGKIAAAAKEAVAAAQTVRDRALASSLVLMAVALAAGIAAGCVVSRSITRPVGDALRLARAVADGDLGSRIEPRGDDEVRELLGALATMNGNLASVVATVRSSSDSIATGSGQIAAGNTDLSQRTEEQASSLQQTASAMEELAGTVRNSTDTAQQARQLAHGASEAAGRGGAVVQQVVTTMQGITDSSRRIGEIIGTIDGIAFQTNILALNAAVEAARAGEQGRGFAVVASEVRALAQRSAEAAREIKSLIGASVEQVESGARLVDEAGNAMGDIVTQVKRVSDLIAEISAAANEQNSGLGQINDAVSQLDKMTQQNSALVEESAAAAKSLALQAEGLVEAVRMFKLDAGNTAAARAG